MSRVVIVTTRWDEPHSESADVLRLLAGALTGSAKVDVVALGTRGGVQSGAARTRRDSVFDVHHLPGTRADPVRAALVRAALVRGPAQDLPEIAGPRLAGLGGGRSDALAGLVGSMSPDAVVLAGPDVWWVPESLRSLPGRMRLVALPLLGDDPAAGLPALRPLLRDVDAVGVLSGLERARFEGARNRPNRLEGAGLERARFEGAQPEVIRLDVAFAINRSTADGLLLGAAPFGRYVVLLTGFPPGTPGATRSPGHEYVREVLGDIAVAEVGHERWMLTDATNAHTLPVELSRVNLWRLVRRAEVVLDLRPQGIVGRETIEALLLGTPVVVPEGTVAAEHAQASDGGLWYRDFAELFDAGRAVLGDRSLRDRLGAQGRAWAERVHGDQASFVEEATRLVLGGAQ